MSEDQKFHVECPHCEHDVKAPEKHRGKAVECPSCDGKFRLPEGETEAPASNQSPEENQRSMSQSPSRPDTATGEEYLERVQKVGRYQKYVLWLFFFGIASGVASMFYTWAVYIQFGIGVAQILTVYQLASALNFGITSIILLTAGQIIPCLNLILILFLMRKASDLYSELDVLYGYSMGARGKSLSHLMSEPCIQVGLMGVDLDEVHKKTKQLGDEQIAKLFE